jgi:hypothetical protein
MKERRKNIIISILPFVAVPLLYLIIYIYNLLPHGLFPCPIYFFWHFYCFGCGGTRSVIHLLHGEFFLSLRCNAVVTVAALICLLIWIENIFSLFGKKIKILPSEKYIPYAAIIAVIYLIARNFFPILAPV